MNAVSGMRVTIVPKKPDHNAATPSEPSLSRGRSVSKKRSIQGRLTSQSGDRVIFEKLAAPRPAPKVAVKSKWLKMTFQAAGNSVRTVSKEDVGTHLSEQEVITGAFLAQRSEYSGNRTSEKWFEQILYSRRPS